MQSQQLTSHYDDFELATISSNIMYIWIFSLIMSMNADDSAPYNKCKAIRHTESAYWTEMKQRSNWHTFVSSGPSPR